MDPMTAIGLATTAVELFMKVEPVIAKGITDFKPFAIAFYEKITGKPITPEQREALETSIDDLHNEFQKPIPAEEDR